MEDGPPGFPRDFSCPVVLGKSAEGEDRLSPTGLLPALARLSSRLQLACPLVTPRPHRGAVRPTPATPVTQRPRAITCHRFGLFPVRSPLLRESRLFSVPRGTEMVHFPPFAPRRLFDSAAGDPDYPGPGCPIRTSSGQCLLAAHRGLSQLTTSFIAFLRQGIHRTPFLTWPQNFCFARFRFKDCVP